MELPPRARRIRELRKTELSKLGTTSACAENTNQKLWFTAQTGNYLRVRGEYEDGIPKSFDTQELPPRARRIRKIVVARDCLGGTTSACAENTAFSLSYQGGCRNYLRVRGEYRSWHPRGPEQTELPPRARRIRKIVVARDCLGGTTSACAENTAFSLSYQGGCRNYLRVRGEYRSWHPRGPEQTELPPRARRILSAHDHGPPHVGTTSACAENTTPT